MRIELLNKGIVKQIYESGRINKSQRLAYEKTPATWKTADIVCVIMAQIEFEFESESES